MYFYISEKKANFNNLDLFGHTFSPELPIDFDFNAVLFPKNWNSFAAPAPRTDEAQHALGGWKEKQLGKRRRQ